MSSDKEIAKLLDEDSLKKYELYNEIIEKIKKDGIKDFKFRDGYIIMCGKNFIYQKENVYEKNEIFLKGSRIFYFINEKARNKNKAFFIHDKDSLEKALKETDIKNGLLKKKDDNLKKKENYDSKGSRKSEDSSNSGLSINGMDVSQILETSYNIIEEPTPIMINKILKEEKFNLRHKITSISNLDFNFKYLKDEEYNKNKVEYIETQNVWCVELENIMKNNKPYYIFGPKGIGKTTLLLKYLNLNHIPRLYFSLNIMNKLGTIKKWKKYSLRESIYIFDSLEQMQKFSCLNINDNCNNSNLMEFILSYIKLINDFCSSNGNAKKKKIFFVIDDYNDELYDKTGVIEEIKDYVKKNKVKLRLCILGNGKYINEKLCQYFFDEATDFIGMYWNLSIENSISSKNKILKIPKYYYKYKDSNNLKEDEITVKTDIAEQFQEIKLNSFIFLSKYMNSFINLKDFEDEFIKLPLEYLTIQKIRDDNSIIKINLSFNSEIYKEVFDETIKGLLKIENLKKRNIIFNDEKKEKDGTDFEDLIIEQFWNNSFECIQFPENNKLKVKNIYDLKFYKKETNENNKKKQEINVNINDPIIIKQEDFEGKYYDLLLILSKNGKNYAIFIQIGLNMTGYKINSNLENLTNNEEKYKEGINALIGHKIDKIGFLLIFESQHQVELLKENIKTEGVLFCKFNDLDYLIYKDFKLFMEVDDDEPIKSFDVRKMSLIYVDNKKEKENENGLNINRIIDRFSEFFTDLATKQNSEPIIPLSEEEKSIILDFIKNNYKADYDEFYFGFTIFDNKGKGACDFGRINYNNFNQINVFINKTNKYFYFNNELFKIANGKIEKIKQNNVEEEFSWDIYFLKKKRTFKNED